MIVWLLALASAEPVLRKEARMPYPVRDVYDASVERRCVVEVEVDANGKPASIRAGAPCDEGVQRRTLKRMKRWRWEKEQAGSTQVEVVYVPPVLQLEPLSPDTWRWRELPTCHVRLVIDLAGAITVAEADEGCTPTVTQAPPTPEPYVAKRAPEVCQMVFLATEGGAQSIERFRCDLRQAKHWATVVRAQTWPLLDGSTPYSLIVQLQGRE